MSEPVDPIKFDFGFNFKPAHERAREEGSQRAHLRKHDLQYHVSFLDDALRVILPHDLVIIGAETGVGKTELAVSIAKANARRGKRVHYFALEAENLEIERRIKYALLSEFALKRGAPGLESVSYVDWYLGRCEDVLGPFEQAAQLELDRTLKTLHTYYRGSSFGSDEMRRLLLAVQSETDLIVLDHLHYVDIDDENENRGFKATVKMIRDVVLGIGKPMILVVHLRKRDIRARQIVPSLDDVHGSSDIAKIATRAIMLSPARSQPSRDPSVAHTFVTIPKDRVSGATGHVALCRFDRRFRVYRPEYTLGWASGLGDVFEPIDMTDRPRWAKGHRPMYPGTEEQ